MAFKRSRADLRALQVLENANASTLFGGHTAQRFDMARMVLM
jgi:hypothetical protein